MERDFTPKGNMKVLPKSEAEKLEGFLPFYSVDTREEADALIEAAVESGEFFRREDDVLIEVTLAYEQTLDNLQQAGENLKNLHEILTIRKEVSLTLDE